jgi:hypothetical protein
MPSCVVPFFLPHLTRTAVNFCPAFSATAPAPPPQQLLWNGTDETHNRLRAEETLLTPALRGSSDLMSEDASVM